MQAAAKIFGGEVKSHFLFFQKFADDKARQSQNLASRPFMQNGLQAESGFEVCFDVGSQHLGCWGQTTSQIQNEEVYATLRLQATFSQSAKDFKGKVLFITMDVDKEDNGRPITRSKSKLPLVTMPLGCRAPSLPCLAAAMPRSCRASQSHVLNQNGLSCRAL